MRYDLSQIVIHRYSSHRWIMSVRKKDGTPPWRSRVPLTIGQFNVRFPNMNSLGGSIGYTEGTYLNLTMIN